MVHLTCISIMETDYHRSAYLHAITRTSSFTCTADTSRYISYKEWMATNSTPNKLSFTPSNCNTFRCRLIYFRQSSKNTCRHPQVSIHIFLGYCIISSHCKFAFSFRAFKLIVGLQGHPACKSCSSCPAWVLWKISGGPCCLT